MDDESVRHKSAAFIARKIGAQATLKYYEGGCHTVLAEDTPLRQKICQDVYGFLTDF